MEFVQIGMLGALTALGIPILIHLMFRQRFRSVELGTLQFLKVVLRDNARKRRLRRYILLALRMACIALLAFLFARPFLLATEQALGDRLVVILLDRSASMGLDGGARPFDRALAEANALIAKSGQGTQLEVALFDRVVSPVASPTELSRKTPALSASGTNYSTALAWARDICVRSSRKSKELHILTDLQRSGLDRGETMTLPSEVDVRLSDFGRAFPKNCAVTHVAIAPKSVRPGESATVTATVFNAAPLPVTKLPVRLHVESEGVKRDAEKTIDLDGNASSTVEFEVKEIGEGLWRGLVQAGDGDDLPFDDRRYLVINASPPPNVLLVDGAPGRTAFDSETYFLQAALRLAPTGEHYAKASFDPTVLAFTSRTSLPDLTKTTAVVLANVGEVSDTKAQRLSEFVKQGGGLLVFTGDQMLAQTTKSLVSEGLGVGAISGPERAMDLPWRLDRWDTSHPIFKPFEDPEHGDLRRPTFTTITRITPDPQTRVLATFRGGAPAVLERSQGKGKVIWFATACDRAWGDWPRSRLYLPLVHQMVSYVTGLAEGGSVRQEVAEGEKVPGIVDSEGLVHVINPDPFESETARCTAREFADRFGFSLPEPGARNVTAATVRKSSDDRLRGDEIWPWLAVTLCGFLFLENVLANRTAA